MENVNSINILNQVNEEEDLQKLKDEYEASPFWQHMGIKMDQIERNFVRMRMQVSPNQVNINGVLHGGVIASLLDSVMGVSLRIETGASVATISLTTQFIAPVFQGTTLYTTGRVVQSGRRISSLEAKIESESGELIASGVGTFIIKKNRQ